MKSNIKLIVCNLEVFSCKSSASMTDHLKEINLIFQLFRPSIERHQSGYFHTLPAVADTVLTLTLAKLRLNQ